MRSGRLQPARSGGLKPAPTKTFENQAVPKLLVLSSLLWPLLLGATIVERQNGQRPLWTVAVYAAASRICHQRPDRSFFAGTVQWPVCARCSGLYLSAPIGALLGLGWRRRSGAGDRARLIVAIASVPTVATLVLEWLQLAVPSNTVRAVSAVPLGIAIAFVLVRAAAGIAKSDRVD